MKKRNTTIGLALLLTGLLALSACRKKEKETETPQTDVEQATTNDNNLAETIDNDIETMGGQVSENGSLTTFRSQGNQALSGEDLKLAATCATVTGIGSQTVTVDFGAGCTGLDGRIRSGKLIFNFSASTPSTAVYYRNPGFSMTITSQNYAVDGYQVNIVNKTITNTTPASIPYGPNPGTNLTWSVSANVSIIKPNNAGTISWSCSRTKELLNTSSAACYQGQSTAINWQQAQVQLNGTSSGVNANGENFSATATNLVRYFTCTPDPLRPHRHPFISGTIAYNPGNRPQRLINFGSVSSCDFNATLTIGNQTFNIILP